jgi:Flp pilus assembly protein TadB
MKSLVKLADKLGESKSMKVALFKKNKPTSGIRKNKKSWSDIVNGISEMAINKITFVNKYYEYLCSKFRIVSRDGKAARIKALRSMQYYTVGAILVVLLTMEYASTWYIFLLNVSIAVIIPYVIINMYLNNLVNKALKQLPSAIDELESAYFKTGTLYKAIETSLPYMPKEIEVGFRNLYFNMMRDQEQAIQEFKQAYSHPYTDSLASLFNIYYKRGGEIERQLQYLNNIIQADITIKSYTKTSLTKYKVLSAITVIMVPIMVLLNTKLSDQAREFLTQTLEGNSIVAMAIASAVIYFIIVEILERI